MDAFPECFLSGGDEQAMLKDVVNLEFKIFLKKYIYIHTPLAYFINLALIFVYLVLCV